MEQMHSRFVYVALLAFSLFCAAPDVVRAQQITAIVHGRIIDGNGGAPVEDGAVIIKDDRILAVGPSSTIAIPRGATLIDARGKTVTPGLADMHVHLGYSWDGSPDMLNYRRQLN